VSKEKQVAANVNVINYVKMIRYSENIHYLCTEIKQTIYKI
jgi:hypothetical protein